MQTDPGTTDHWLSSAGSFALKVRGKRAADQTMRKPVCHVWPIALIALAFWSTPRTVAAGGRIQPHRAAPPPQLQPNRMVPELQAELERLRQRLALRSRPVRLDEAVERSLLHNPILAESYSQIQQRQWSLIAVRRQWYPQAQVSPAGSNLFGYQGTTNNRVTSNRRDQPPGTDFGNQTEFGTAIQLSWTFFDPSRGPEINASSDSLKAQKLLFDVTARDLVLETQIAYFSLQEQQMLIGYYEKILNSTTRQVDQAEALYNIGAAAISDVEQIRTLQLQNLTTLIDTYRQLVDASARLAQAMALPAGELVRPLDGLTLMGNWPLQHAETMQQAERFREEILASLALASSAQWRAKALFNQYWPRLTTVASGSFSIADRSLGTPGSDLTFNSQTNRSNGAIGLGFSWLLFDGGISAAEGEVSLYQARQFNNQTDQIRLNVAREVERAFANYQSSKLAMISSKQQLSSAELAATAVQERFMVGFSDMTSVVQTYNQTIAAATSYARAIREHNASVAGLYRFSAQWPEGSSALVQQRVQNLK